MDKKKKLLEKPIKILLPSKFNDDEFYSEIDVKDEVYSETESSSIGSDGDVGNSGDTDTDLDSPDDEQPVKKKPKITEKLKSMNATQNLSWQDRVLKKLDAINGQLHSITSRLTMMEQRHDALYDMVSGLRGTWNQIESDNATNQDFVEPTVPMTSVEELIEFEDKLGDPEFMKQMVYNKNLYIHFT